MFLQNPSHAQSQPSYCFTGIQFQSASVSKYQDFILTSLRAFLAPVVHRETLYPILTYYKKSVVKYQFDCYHTARLFA